ncbi:MAG TPA: sodium:proton exchanger [Chloroflexota bacterium]|nr:sodium:proton exchanger [Chloroflexota bacterium]
MSAIRRSERITLGVALVTAVLSGLFHVASVAPVATFVVSGLALAVLAALIGQAIDQLGQRLSAGATGVLQSALGNLPELFIGLFSLRAGLVALVQAALIGSVLANSLLVLGLALCIGGLKNGTQRFQAEAPRAITTLTLLAVAALVVPTLAVDLKTPAAQHASALSIACALVLLVVFAVSIPFSLGGGASSVPLEREDPAAPAWSIALTVVVLLAAGVLAAFVSEWFVDSLTPTIQLLHISQTFTGLIIVAIAGNAVENVVGVRLAAANKADYALSIILNSSLQVALGLTPVLVLLSFLIGGATLTLVMPPLLLVVLGLAAVLGLIVVFDGETNWLEGVALIGLYGIIGAAFWWG